jgi:hypothetical protein
VLKSAFAAGLNDDQAIAVAKKACASSTVCKKEENRDQQKLAAYSEGFKKRAAEAGMTEGQAVDSLNAWIGMFNKKANDGMPIGPMGGAPQMGGGAGAGGMDAAAGGLDINALLQMILGGAGAGGAAPGAGGGMDPSLFKNMGGNGVA